MIPVPLESISSIKDQPSFFSFLRNYLSWPIEEDINFEDATFYWDTEEFGYNKNYFRGSSIYQLRPFVQDQPWGIFILHLSTPRIYISELKNILRSLSPSVRKLKDYPTWKPNHLLFICTHDWKNYTFAHFEGDKPQTAKLATFSWEFNSSYLRTVCEYNLSALRMPENLDLFGEFDRTEWIKNWSEAFSIKKVTDKFFEEMVTVFNTIQDKYVKGITGEVRRSFTQLLINRLLFLKFLEKKGWLFVEENDSDQERKNYLNRQLQKHKDKNLWDQFFYHLFFRGLNRISVAGKREIPEAMRRLIGNVPFLNGGLFEDDPVYKSVKVDNKAFELIFNTLLNPYNFTIEENTPLDVEVALNPDLLGYAYEELIAERHGQGAYYTHPTEVGLMCRESLKTFLEEHTKIDKAAIAHLVDLREADDLTDDEAFEIYRKLINIKIVDPAIGSGAYPVRMMQELVGIHQALAEKLSQGNLRLIIESKLADPNNRYQLKLSIMQNNLYGADIDYFAVEIAELRFWLSLVVDYDVDVNDAKDLDNIPALPNLDFKLRVGDSLLSILGKGRDKGEKINLDLILKNKNPDVFFMEEANKLRKMKENYFKFEQLRKEKKIPTTLTKEDLRKGIIKQEETLAGAIGIKQYDKFDKSHHILWEIHFAEVFDETEGFGFDVCIANPPYLRQEKINEIFKRFDSGITKDDLVEAYEKLFDDIKLKINKQSDLYVYFYFRGINLLKEKGVLCFICSNSWLDVGYGGPLQEFFLRKTRIKAIYDNSAQRSFEKADVNTTINLFIKDSKSVNLNEDTATGKKELLAKNVIRFVTFKDKFEQTAVSKEMVKISEADKISKNENWRVYPIKQNELYENGLDEDFYYDGDKWGAKFFRLNDFLIPLIEKNILIPLKSVCKLSYGNKPGIVDFFIFDEEKNKQFKIDKTFLKKIITSTKEIYSLKVDPNQIEKYIFICDLTLQQLKEKGFVNTIAYIKWGKKQKTKKKASHTINNVIWPEVPSVKSNLPDWYCLQLNDPGDFIIPRLIRERFFFAYNKYSLHDTDMFFHGRFYDRKNSTLGVALLNSTIVYLMLEIYGRQNIEGRFNIYGPDLKPLPVPNLTLFTSLQKDQILESFNSMLERDMKKIRDEIKMPDRQKMDTVIFNSLGLTKAEREEVYYAVCELVQNRLNKARSV